MQRFGPPAKWAIYAGDNMPSIWCIQSLYLSLGNCSDSLCTFNSHPL